MTKRMKMSEGGERNSLEIYIVIPFLVLYVSYEYIFKATPLPNIIQFYTSVTIRSTTMECPILAHR